MLALRRVSHAYGFVDADAAASAPARERRLSGSQPGTSGLVLDGIDLELAAGARCVIMGPSGSGKSTLLHIAAGLERALRGDVLWAGRPIQNVREPERTRLRRRFTGVVFQDFHLLAALSARENVELALALSRPEWPAAERRARARALLDRMALGERQQRAAPETLSGGERQRVAVARALAHAPRLVLADEPTGRLDHANGERVIECLSAGVADAGAALLVVTHDRTVAERLTARRSGDPSAQSGRCLTLRDGRWVDASGDADSAAASASGETAR